MYHWGAIKMTGRHLYVTLDAATNRIIIPVGGTRLSIRIGMPVRFEPSIKDVMVIETAWRYRRLTSSEPWVEIIRGSHSRTATQTTAALSLGSSVSSYQMPDYPVEIELVAKLVKEGTTGIKWPEKKFFSNVDDYIQISATKNANKPYETK